MTAQPDPLIVDGSRPAIELVAALPAGWLTDAERLVLFALACDSYDGRHTAPGIDNVAAWTGLLPTSVKRIMGRLKVATSGRPALVTTARRSKGHHRTTWQLTLPPPSDAERSPAGDRGPSPTRARRRSPDGLSTVSDESPSTVSPQAPTGAPPYNPSDTPPPPAALVEWLAAEDGIPHDLAAAIVSRAEDDPTTRSAPGRLRASADYRRQLERSLRDERRAAERSGRKCLHGVVDGMRLDGAVDPSRRCGRCETEHPASSHVERVGA